MTQNSQPLLKNISILYRIWQIYMENDLKKINIKSWQGPFLMCLYKKEWLSQEEISKWLNIDKGTTAKAIKKLEENWYVLRTTDSIDKRIQRVYLTDKWIQIKPEFLKSINNWRNIICKDVSEEDESSMIKTLEKIVENAKKYTKN